MKKSIWSKILSTVLILSMVLAMLPLTSFSATAAAKEQAAYGELAGGFAGVRQVAEGDTYPQLQDLPPAGSQSDVTVTLDGVAANQTLGSDFNSLFHYEANLRSVEPGYDVLYSGEMATVIPDEEGNKGQGIFSFENVENGRYILELKAPGYITRYLWVTVDDDNRDFGPYKLAFGDFNGDFKINIEDLNIYMSSENLFDYDAAGDQYNVQFDWDCDGSIILSVDMVELMLNFGKETYNAYDADMMEIYGLLHKATWVTLTGVADNPELGDDFNKLFIYRVTLRDPENATIKYTAEMSILPGTRVGYKSSGLFTFEGVEDGKYILELKAPGYMTKWEYVTIGPNTRDLGNRTLMFGDLNGSFYIDAFDLQLWQDADKTMYLVAGNDYKLQFDYNCDGLINSSDRDFVSLGNNYSDYGQSMIDIYENVPLRKLLLGNDTDLLDLRLSIGTLNPDFNPNTFSYTAYVPNSVTSITISATANDLLATVAGTGLKYLEPGTESFSFEIEVTAWDGITKQTYTLTVTRGDPPGLRLSNLSLSSGTPEPEFDPEKFEYTAYVDNKTTSTVLTAVASDPSAFIFLEDMSNVYVGELSESLELEVGENNYQILLTTLAGDSQEYTLTIIRQGEPQVDPSKFLAPIEAPDPYATKIYTAR